MTRTLNLLIRSQMLYPLSYERLCREMSVVVGREMPRSQILSLTGGVARLPFDPRPWVHDGALAWPGYMPCRV